MSAPFLRRLAVACLAVGVTLGAAYVLPPDGVAHGGMWRLLGRLHPLLVHFPVALLLIVPVLEWFGHKRPGLHEAAGFVLGTALIGTVGAVLAGLALAHADGHEGALLATHLRGGLAVAIGTALAWLCHGHARVAYGFFLLSTVGVLAWAAHNGGSLTHGAYYLTEALPPSVRKVLHLPEPPKPEAYPAETVFGGVIRPILEKYCFTCHGAEKQKGDYRMDTFATLFAGGKSGKPAITAKDTANSELIRRLLLEPDDEKAMPPRKKPRPKAGDVALIRWWIKQGASRDLLIADVKDAPAEVAALLAAATSATATDEPVYVPRVGDYAPLQKQIRALESKLGITLVPVSHRAGDGLILRTRAAKARFGDNELAQLAPVAPFIVEAELAGTGVTDAGLAALKPFKQLERLHLERTSLTGKTLGELKPLSKLTYLNLCVTRVSDEALSALGQLSALRQLYVFGSQITPTGLEQLKTALPQCEVGSVTIDRDPAATQP